MKFMDRCTGSLSERSDLLEDFMDSQYRHSRIKQLYASLCSETPGAVSIDVSSAGEGIYRAVVGTPRQGIVGYGSDAKEAEKNLLDFITHAFDPDPSSENEVHDAR